MTVTANNPALYNAAYSAALAGQLAGNGLTGIPAVDDSTSPSVYAKASNVASAFAFQFDQVAFTTPVTNLSGVTCHRPPGHCRRGGDHQRGRLGSLGPGLRRLLPT